MALAGTEQKCFICKNAIAPDQDSIKLKEIHLKLPDGREVTMELDPEVEVVIHIKDCLAQVHEIAARQYAKWEEEKIGNRRLN